MVAQIKMSTNSKLMYEALDRSGIITLRFDKDSNGHDIMVTENPELAIDGVWLLGYAENGDPRPESNTWVSWKIFSERGCSYASGWYEGKIVETACV